MREQREQQQEQKQEGSTEKAFASLTNQPQEPEPSRDATVRSARRRPPLMLAAAALLGGGYGYTRRPRADEQYGVAPRPRVLDRSGANRVAAAEAKRARKAAKRRRSA